MCKFLVPVLFCGDYPVNIEVIMLVATVCSKGVKVGTSMYSDSWNYVDISCCFILWQPLSLGKGGRKYDTGLASKPS